MKLIKKNTVLITVSILIILIFIFFTGSIKNCVQENETYTSYFSFKKEHNQDNKGNPIYQGLYFSQSKSIFYGIYAKPCVDYEKMELKGMELKAMNYRKTLPFMQRIGFDRDTLRISVSDSILYKVTKDTTSNLQLNLVLDKYFSSKKKTYIKLLNPIKIKNLTEFNVTRYFSYKNIGEKIKKDTCFIIGQQHAVGLNCIESKLTPIY